MKPAKVGVTANTALASWQASGGANSQIPLPLRRGSNKSEKGVESDAPDSGDSAGKDRQKKIHPEKSTLKSSILGSSSFCCAAGQKEDYERLPSSRPIKKKLPKNAPSKRSSEKADSPSVNAQKKTQLTRCRQTKIDNDTSENKCNKEIVKPGSNEGPPPTKPRGLTHPAPPIHERRSSPRINNNPGRLQDGKKPNPELSRSDTRASPETERGSGKQKYTEVIRKLSKDPPECTSNNLTSLNVQSDKLYEKGVTGQIVTSDDPKIDVMAKSCGTEDLDCPCCDSVINHNMTKNTSEVCVPLSVFTKENPPVADQSCSNIEICKNNQENDLTLDIDKEKYTEREVTALREELETERLFIRKQQLQIRELEKEVETMEQLKHELIKEKELRIEAEQKLMESLARDKLMLTENYEIKSRLSAFAEDLNCLTLDSDDRSSQLLLGYESRIRRYQTYITKLEKDNIMLMNELKNFHELSPSSKEQQAESLLVKLGQLERDNQQQQKEYESCLDEVANKLVHTLLMQKRLEEECKLLHLRVDQLELENSELLKIIKTAEKCEEKIFSHTVFQNGATSSSVPSTPLPSEVREMNANNIFSQSMEGAIPVSKENVHESKKMPPKPELTNNNNVNPCDKTGSKIPAFNNNSAKATPNRKRTKPESTHNVVENNKNTRLSSSEANSPVQADVPPISKMPSPSETTSNESTVHRVVKQKLPSLLDSPTKLPSVKRKRSTKSNYSDKSSKDSKIRSASRRQQRISDSQQAHESSTKIALLPKATTIQEVDNVSTPESTPIVQEVWSFSCTVENNTQHVISEAINSVKWKLDSSSINECPLNEKLEDMDDVIDKLSSSLRETESSVSTDGTHRTKDEGYSTMSSDLQQDSAADTTVSEHEEPSTTFLAPGSRFVSDDSVTECLDGSMTSSSDSGFGPLQQIALSSQMHLSQNSKASSLSTATKGTTFEPSNVISTVSTYLSDYSQKTVDIGHLDENLRNGVYAQSSFIPPDSSVKYSTIIIRENANTPRTLPNETEACISDAVSNISSTNAVECQTSNRYSQTSSASSDSRKSVIECITHDSEIANKSQETECRLIETAEKATLTEPEEELWREKALAHFIDESIWSLYSSESDTQFRYFSTDLKTEVSPLESVAIPCPPSDISPNIVITGPEESPDSNCTDQTGSIENAYAQLNSELATLLFSKPDVPDIKMCTSGRDTKCTRRASLERVASDSLLYQKDAVHELEDALKPGLKTTRHFAFSKNNIPLFRHFSLSNIYNPAVPPPTISHNKMSPEILMNLEKTMLQNNYIWPLSVNASRSSSLCSIPSSNSCQVISDETDDVDNMRHPSRKGSQDPDLSSASDAEYENLEHKDFVERWIQKEITQKVELNSPKSDQEEKAERKSFPCVKRKDFSPHTDSPFSRNVRSLSWAKCSTERNLCYGEEREVSPYDNEQHHVEAGPDCLTEMASCDDVRSFASSSSIVYPIIFTCENIEEDVEPSTGMNEIEADLQLLDSDLKEFNGDFYRLCDVATSSLSLDRSHLPVILERFDQLETASMASSASPSLYRHKVPSNLCISNPPDTSTGTQKSSDSSSKPTGFVKPMRPVTLTFCDTPRPLSFYRLQKKNPNGELKKPSETNQSCLIHSKGKSLKDNGKKDISPCRRNSESAISSRMSKVRGATNQRNVMRSNSQPCPQILCSYTATKSSLPENQNAMAKTQSKSNANSIICATENPRLLPIRKSYNKPKNCVVSPEKVCRSGLPSPKDNGVISKRYQWRKDRKQQNSKEGCGTAWVHLQANPSLSDPKTRASLLDSMADTLSSSGSSSEGEDDMPLVQSNSHLQRICREKRQRIKASRGEDFIALSPRHRSSVINRHSLYFRFGDQEKAAISCFDFLEDIPTSASEPGSLETFSSNKRLVPPSELNTSGKRSELNNKERVNLVSPCTSETKSRQYSNNFGSRLRVPVLWNQPLCHNMSSSTLNSQDCEILDHVSLSDSCAESYSSTPDSFEEVS